MDVKVYRRPNKAIADVLLSREVRSQVNEHAELAQALYREVVAKRTGRLAASARVHTEIGGKRNDRWIGVLTVGEGVDYGLAHEFGYQPAQDSAVSLDDYQVGHHDLNMVLDILSAGAAML